MKALILSEYNRLDYVDYPVPEIRPHDVLVRVRACGICGSDIHGLDGSSGRRLPPLIMGHEAAGDIERVGSEVARWKVGDRVTFDSTIYCGSDCDPCRRGLTNLCEQRKVVGVSIPEYRAHGAFAEYVALPEHILYRLPEAVTYQQGAGVEPLSIAVHAVSLAPVTPDSSVVVVGSGVIGLMLIQVLHAKDVHNIVAVDLSPDRLTMAAKLGATTTLLSNEPDILARIRSLTSPDGADVTFEAVGITPTVTLAIESARKGGTVVLVGNVSPQVTVPLQAIVTRQLTVHGSATSCGEYPECIDLIASGKVDAMALIGAVAPLSEGAAWFERLRNGENGLIKVILEP
jgi:L-iditol 2-dehydrogenase